jgi:hypothetical protein
MALARERSTTNMRMRLVRDHHEEGGNTSRISHPNLKLYLLLYYRNIWYCEIDWLDINRPLVGVNLPLHRARLSDEKESRPTDLLKPSADAR